LAFYAVLGKRRGFGEEKWQPHNHLNIILGFAFLFFGWFGFNAGGATLVSGRAGIAFMTTNIAGAVAGIVWVALAYWQQRRFSSFHFCSGAVAGMVCVTPAASLVSTWAAFPMGAAAGLCCFYAVELSLRLGIDDCIDVFAVHGVGGVLGVMLTGVFANKNIIGLDGGSSQGGLINGYGHQLLIQLAAAAASAAWSFGVSYLVLRAMDCVPIFRFRVDAAAEDHGLDFTELGEAGYSFVRDLALAHAHTHTTRPHSVSKPLISEAPTPPPGTAGAIEVVTIQHPHEKRPMLKGSPSSGTVADLPSGQYVSILRRTAAGVLFSDPVYVPPTQTLPALPDGLQYIVIHPSEASEKPQTLNELVAAGTKTALGAGRSQTSQLCPSPALPQEEDYGCFSSFLPVRDSSQSTLDAADYAMLSTRPAETATIAISDEASGFQPAERKEPTPPEILDDISTSLIREL
ncbi:ammonium transporter, partial [Coemansia furcata]